MKTLLLTALLSCCLCLAYGQNKKALNDKHGFRDVKFEADLSAYPDMVLSPSSGGNTTRKYYTRPNDELKIGDAVLKTILYQFYNNKLASVYISTEGFANSLALQKALRAQYGPGYPALQITEESLWDASKVSMFYRRNQFSGDARVSMYSNEMQKQEKRGDAEAAKNAKSDL